jgi:hypothetical protein
MHGDVPICGGVLGGPNAWGRPNMWWRLRDDLLLL